MKSAIRSIWRRYFSNETSVPYAQKWFFFADCTPKFNKNADNRKNFPIIFTEFYASDTKKKYILDQMEEQTLEKKQ